MPHRILTPEKEFVFVLNDVARLFRTYADHRVAEVGMTRAQWQVLSRLERSEGATQVELATALDSAQLLPRSPITPLLFDDLNAALAAAVEGDATAAEVVAGVRRGWQRQVPR